MSIRLASTGRRGNHRSQMNKYEIIIYWSEEDTAFVAEVPELPGCIGHGPTQEATLANAQEAGHGARVWRLDSRTEGVTA